MKGRISSLTEKQFKDKIS